jgi:hypothetical protein
MSYCYLDFSVWVGLTPTPRPMTGMEIGFICCVVFIPMTFLRVVHGISTPTFLAEVITLLSGSFLGDSGRRLSTRSLVFFLALVGSFLVGLCVGIFLGTYALDSPKRH